MTLIHFSNRFLRSCALVGSLAGCLSAANSFLVHNLVSDQAGVADHTDKNLINPWGNAFSATSPFWVGDNGTGLSTLYDGTGTPNATTIVAVPAAAGATTPGPVTGVIQNSVTTAFLVATGKQSQFAFCSEDGMISGWNSTVDATHAKVILDNSKNKAVYKGCAAATPTGGTPQMYVANFNSGKVEVYDQTMTPITTATFANTAIPAGFAPFNVEIIAGKVYVAYAKQDAAKDDDQAGLGNGQVSVFDTTGTLVKALIPQSATSLLNSPWGLTTVPAGGWGTLPAGTLLVGNFGDGAIHAYDPTSGALVGTIVNSGGTPLLLDGLWSLTWGPNAPEAGTTPDQLYFTSGPNKEANGLYGYLTAQ
jgi:uncharacterized protein (TIGR03118 family)